MRTKVSVYVAMSIDGYIAGPEGSLDWLDEANAAVPKGEDCGFLAFMASVDILVMGRRTYEKVLSFGTWPYAKPVVVLSRNPVIFPPELRQNVSHASESPHSLIERFSGENIGHAYIDGANTIQRFLSDDCIDEITITTVPVVLGSGIPLFANTTSSLHLRNMRTIAYDFGFVQTTYEVPRQVCQ